MGIAAVVVLLGRGQGSVQFFHGHRNTLAQVAVAETEEGFDLSLLTLGTGERQRASSLAEELANALRCWCRVDSERCQLYMLTGYTPG